MQILAFILIGGIWAAFLLPSFFESRRKTPISTTRNFAKSTALLASVSSAAGQVTVARRRTLDRRRRLLIALVLGAAISLAVAVVQGSTTWLFVTLAFDAAIAGYIGYLVHLRQQRASAPRVVPMAQGEPQLAEEPQRHTVRVVNG
jgi:peptidoglycan/LPS O-acetylase OafA/YrhL